MTIQEFKILTEDERYILWLERSVRVAMYEKDFYTYELYQLESFYIEIRSHKFFPGKERWAAFSGGQYIEPYLQQIDISILGYANNI